jgi:hypothetical protein
VSESPDPKLLDALAGLDAEANMAVVQRTRRAVMEKANQMHELGSRLRRRIAIAVTGLIALLMFLTPMLWVIADEAFGGETRLDESGMTALLVATMVFSVFAALAAQWRNQSRRESA